MYFKTERLSVIYFKTYLLVINSHSLCLSANASSFLHLWWEFYCIYILGWQALIFLFHLFAKGIALPLDFIISDEKLVINHMAVSLYMISLLLLLLSGFYKAIFLSNFTMMCPDVGNSSASLNFLSFLAQFGKF